MEDLDVQRRSVRVGLLLFGIFWLLFGGTFLIAFLYLHFD